MKRLLLGLAALALGAAAPYSYGPAPVFSGGGGGGVPTAINFSPSPVAQTIPTTTFIKDTAADGTTANTPSVVMSTGGFSGSLAFRVYSGSDLVIDATTATYATSASHSFFNGVSVTDAVMTCNGTHHSIASATRPAVSADKGYTLNVVGGSGWLLSAWGIPYLNGSGWEINHEGTSTPCPASDGATSGQIVMAFGSDQHQVIQVTGGSGCTVGSYEILDWHSNGGMVADRSMGTPGSTCTWTMTINGGGHFRLSAGKIVTNGNQEIGNKIVNVEIGATQNSTTVYAVVPIEIVAAHEIYQISDDVGNLLNESTACPVDGGAYITECLGTETNGYVNYLTLATGNWGAHPGSLNGNWSWTNRGGDWFDKNGTLNGVGAGNEYAQFVSSNGGASDQTWTFTSGSGAGTMAAAINDSITNGNGLAFLMTMSNPRTVYACAYTTDTTKRPSLSISYSDTTTETLPCIGSAVLGNTDNGQVNMSRPQTFSGGSTTQIGVSFKYPSKTLSISTGTLTMVSSQQFTGSTNVNLYRLAPWPKQQSVVTGIANNYTHDVGICSDPAVFYCFLGDETLSTKYIEDTTDNSNNSNWALDCSDATKYPQRNYGLLVNGTPTTNNNGVLTFSTSPTQVTSSYTTYGYAPPWGATNGAAWQIAQLNAQEIAVDYQLYFIPTATGAQAAGATCVTGVDTAAGKAVSTGKYPTDMYVRWMQYDGADMMAPQYINMNGGKFGPALYGGRTNVCGNGGYDCASPSLMAGRKGFSSRNQWKLYGRPQDFACNGDLGLGSYDYNSQDYQWDRMMAQCIHPLQWYTIEKHLHVNTFVDTGGTTAAGVIVWTQGSTCTNGSTYTVIGGTGSVAAQITTTVVAGKVTAATLANAGTYTVFPTPEPVSVSGGCDATFDLAPVDNSTADGYIDEYLNGRLLNHISGIKFRTGAPWAPTAFDSWSSSVSNGENCASGKCVPMSGNGGIQSMWWNHYAGGTQGAPASPMHYFIKDLVVSTSYVGPPT